MNIKKISNIKYAEGNPVTTPTEEAANLDPNLRAQAESYIDIIDEKLQTLGGSKKDYFEYLSLEEQAEFKYWEEKLSTYKLSLEVLLETGKWNGIGDPSAADSFIYSLPELNVGWNGNYNFMSKDDTDYKKYKQLVKGDPSVGTFQGVIQVPSNGANLDLSELGKQAIGFVLDDSMKSAEGKTVGDNIWLTVEYYDEDGDGNNEFRTWILEGLTTRTDVQIYIYGGQCEKDITVDMSRVVRVSKGTDFDSFGSTGNGLWIIGGKGNDILIGSASSDHIIGGLGDDSIFGMGGKDTIYGDEIYKGPDGSTFSNNEIGGDDYIDGGADLDTIYAGGGAGDKVVQGNDKYYGDTVYESEKSASINSASKSDLEALKEKLILVGWKSDIDTSAGEVTLTKKNDYVNSNNQIMMETIKGYSMLTSEKEGNDLIVTMVKMDLDKGDKEPEYLRLRIKDVLASGNQTKITAISGAESTIMDFSGVNVGSNIVELIGSDTNDALICPKTNLDEYQIDAKYLTGSSTIGFDKIISAYKNSETGKLKWGGVEWESFADNSDHLELKPAAGAEISPNFTLPDNMNFDIDAVYYEVDKNMTDLWIYTIDVKKGGDFDMIKIKIKNGVQTVNLNSITVGGKKATPIGYTLFNSKEGSDLMVGSTGSTKGWNKGSNDTVVESYYPTTWVDNDDGGPKYKDGVPLHLVDEPAEDDDGNPIKTEDGTQLKYNDEAPGVPGKTVYYCIENDINPITGEKNKKD